MSKKLIYHYCSVESFYYIINSKVLWLSDSEYMNDKYESKWIDKIVGKIFKEFKELNLYKKKELKKRKKDYKNVISDKNYLMSFSEVKDYLSQWRGYGDDGRGVIISFDINGYLFKTYGICEDSSTTPKFGFEKVIYNSYNEIQKFMHKDFRNKDLFKIIKDMASRIKHETFNEEKEIRLVYTPENNFQLDIDSWYDKQLNEISEKKYRLMNKNIVAYYEYDFKCKLEFIDSIILGPKCNLNKKDLKEFLDSNGFNHVVIENSKLSYK